MGTGTSVEMFLRHHGGAWVHGSIAADGFDPSAVKGLCHEARSRVRNRAVMVDPAGLPELLGVSEGARQRNQAVRILINGNTKNNKRTDTKLNALIHNRAIDHPYRPYTRKHEITRTLPPRVARRGPFAMYGGLTSHMTLDNAIRQNRLVESEGKWVVCCEIKGASERPEQFDTMIPALREQFGEGCEFGEVKPRMGDRGQGITFLVKVNKDASWCRHEAAGAGTAGDEGGANGHKGPTRMVYWEASEAIGQPVEQRRRDTDWGKEIVYMVRLHSVGESEGPMTRAAIMRIKLARVEREGTEHGRPFVVCFGNFYHPNPRIQVQDMLEPLMIPKLIWINY